MKIHCLLLCWFIGGGLAQASVQTAVNQDKPSRLYVQSYIESRSATIQGTDDYLWNEVDPTYGGHDYEDWREFWGISEMANYHDGSAGSASSQMQEAWDETIFAPGPNGGYHGYENGGYTDAYSISSQPGTDPATVPATMTDTGSNWYYSWATDQPTNGSVEGPSTYVSTNLGFPVMNEHCDVGAPIRDRSRSGVEPYGWNETDTYNLPETYRRTAQTVWHLQTGGKATFGGRNLFALSASAIHYTPVRVDDTGLYAPFDNPYNSHGAFVSDGSSIEPPATNVPPQNIVIGDYGNQKLQVTPVWNGYETNEILYIPLKNNDDVDVTPSVAGLDNYTFTLYATGPKTKADWQKVVQYEIDNDSGVQIENYLAANGFMNNRANIQAVYAFYQKLFTEEPTTFYWCGLAKLAGATVYAGLSDAQWASPVLSSFQQTLIQMNIDILNDLTWQFEAYRNCGTNAIYQAWAASGFDQTVLDSPAMSAWQGIDTGIQTGNVALIQDGNEKLLQREQQQILANGYGILNNMTGISTVMYLEAQSPILLPNDNTPVEAWDFQSVVPDGNLCIYDDRWAWITDSSAGIWLNWLADPNQLSDVEIPLTIRAADYSTLPLQ